MNLVCHFNSYRFIGFWRLLKYFFKNSINLFDFFPILEDLNEIIHIIDANLRINALFTNNKIFGSISYLGNMKHMKMKNWKAYEAFAVH